MSSNGSSNSVIIKNSIFLLIKLLVKLFVSLYCSRLILQELGVTDYGIYNVVGGVVTLLSFLTGSMTSSTQRFLSYEIGSENGRVSEVFSMSVNVYFIIVLITILFSQSFGLWFVENQLTIPVERLEATYWVYQSSVLSFIFLILSAPFNAILIAYEKMKLYSFIGIIVVFTNLALVLMLTIIDGDKLVIYSFMVVIVSFLTLVIPYVYLKFRITDIHYKWIIDMDLLKAILSFTGWSLYGNLSGVGFNQGISILMNMFFGPTVNASRAISNQVYGALLGIVGNVNTAVNPQIIKSYSAGDNKRMIELMYTASKYSFLCLSFISIPILVNIDYILEVWLGNVPKYTVEFTMLVIFDGLVCAFSGSLMASIQATGRIKYYQITIGTILMLNLPFSYFLLTVYDNVFIPFLVTIGLSFAAFNFRIIFVKKYLNISILEYYKKVVLGALISFLLSIASVLYISKYLAFFSHSFVASVIISVCSSLFFIWFISLNNKEKEVIRSFIRTRFNYYR
ncbi:conserved membrane hypothetical protein [Vibrio chagasii]|nr:conserved membrane hypothetical protein [Vibrio chagasii]